MVVQHALILSFVIRIYWEVVAYVLPRRDLIRWILRYNPGMQDSSMPEVIMSVLSTDFGELVSTMLWWVH